MGESVRQITLLKHMPAESSIYRWLMQHDNFRKNYEIAKGLQAYRFGEELLEIADDSRNDWIEREDARTGKVTLVPNQELVERARLRVHARQWLMAKHAPRKYGDKVELEHSGKIDSNVMVLSEKQRAEIIKRRRAAVEFGKS